MAHEIEEHDKVALLIDKAWHGLGTIVKTAMSAMEILPTAPGDYDIDQWPLYATDGEGNRIVIPDRVANVRRDVKLPLGIVSKGYRPIQNRELAAFCDALVEQGDKIKVESAGSIRNGAKVWFLIRGESFSVRGKDEVAPYLLASNGHDGWTSLRLTPTTIRVVCSNTLHMVIPRMEGMGIMQAAPVKASFVAHHTQSIMERVEEAKRALMLYGRAETATREVINLLAAKDVDNETVKRFLLECYVRNHGAFPATATNGHEERARARAMASIQKMHARFEADLGLTGATAWGLLNAVTGFEYHDQPSRIKDAAKKADRHMESRLFGVGADRADATLRAALALAS